MELLILVVVLGIKHLCPNALMYHSLNPSSGSVFSHLSIHACMHASFYPASSIHVALLELFKLSRYITLSDRTYWETNPCSTCELETTVAEYSMKVVLPDTHGRMCQLPPLWLMPPIPHLFNGSMTPTHCIVPQDMYPGNQSGPLLEEEERNESAVASCLCPTLVL